MTAARLIGNRYRLRAQLPAVPPRQWWQAQDEWSGRQVVATRVPMPGLTQKQALHARYRISREVRTAEGCPHPHLRRPMNAVLDSEDLWVISEPGPETTLAGVLAEHDRVEPDQALRWARDIAEGLAAAHAAGLVHRDLHAGLIGVADDGTAVLTGLAATVVTPEGLREGIPLHVPPEVVDGAEPSPAGDIFALAVMVLRAVQGDRHATGAGGRGTKRDTAVAGVVAPPQRAEQLNDALTQMLHPDPSRRPSAPRVCDLLTHLPPAAGEPPTLPARRHPAGHRRGCRRGGAGRGALLVTAVLLALLALLTLIAVAIGTSRPVIHEPASTAAGPHSCPVSATIVPESLAV